MAYIGFCPFYSPNGELALKVPVYEITGTLERPAAGTYVNYNVPTPPILVDREYLSSLNGRFFDYKTAPASVDDANASNTFETDNDGVTLAIFPIDFSLGLIGAYRLINNGGYAEPFSGVSAIMSGSTLCILKLSGNGGHFMLASLTISDEDTTLFFDGDVYNDIGRWPTSIEISGSPDIELKKMTNFYLADFSGEYPVEREQPIKLERLQSTELRFCAVYEDGTFGEWTGDVTYTAVRGDGAFSIDGNQITIAEDARVPNVTLLARPVYDNLDGDKYATASIDVTNPVEPYTPPSGGGGGAGAGGGAGLPSGAGGGGGSFPSNPGPSLVDQTPSGQTGNDIAQSGLFTMYLMNQQYMNLMGEILWEDNVAIQAIKEIFGNPIDSVISTISYPFNLLNLVSYGARNLYIGPWDTGLPFQALTKSSFQIDWGTLSIPFAWGNFLDYSPHTKMELFLPWGPGYVTIDPNDVSPFSNSPGNFDVSTFTAGSIQVKTNVELGKGTCVHNVIGNNGRVIGSYSGIVGKQVPITALDTGGKALTTIAAVSAVVGGVVAGSLAAKGAMDSGRLTGTPMRDPMRPLESASYWDTGMISGRASAQSLINAGHNLASRAINSTPITFPRAGTFSDGSSAMTVQTPFLIISRPVQSVPTQYGHYNGYPSNIHYPNFSNISGYTEISEIHLDNVTATADELQELDAILKGGILL